MGFFTKLKNLFTLKGWKEDEQKEEKPTQPYEQAEDQQYKDIQPQTQQETPEEIRTQISAHTEELAEQKKETEELNQALRKIQQQPTTQTLNQHIKTTPENTIIQQKGQDLNALKPQYHKLFTDNAKLNDNDILDILYENRHSLQHRFTTQVIVHIEGKYANTLEIFGALIEHNNLIDGYIHEGMQIDSTAQLDNILNDAGMAVRNAHGASNHTLHGNNAQTGKITNIQKITTFA